MSLRTDFILTSEGTTITLFSGTQITFGFTEGAGDASILREFLEHRGVIAPGIPVFHLIQEHTNRIHRSDSVPPDTVGDGFLLDSPGTLGIIRTADCTPLFFWETIHGNAGLLHVGWKGLSLGIVENLLATLESGNGSSRNVHFYLGPAIEGDCYPVGEELLDHFPQDSPARAGFRHTPGGLLVLDVRDGITCILRNSGIPADQVTRSPICTFCDPRFPSFRRDGDGCGRILSFMVRHT